MMDWDETRVNCRKIKKNKLQEGQQQHKKTLTTTKAGTKDELHAHSSIPSLPTSEVVKKIILGIIFIIISLVGTPLFPMDNLKDALLNQRTSFVYKLYYIMIGTSLVRFKYYHAWLLADAVANASGLGFNGYDENGSPKWDLVSNMNILKFEFASSLRDVLQNWNMGTMAWLRRIAYDRVPFMKTWNTFLLSALWHGFYPGYYVTFITAALITVASREVRRRIRPFFQKTTVTSYAYNILTIILTKIWLGYLTAPFVMLDLSSSISLYMELKFFLHILCLFAVFVLPKIIASPAKRIMEHQNGKVEYQNGKVEHQNGKVELQNGKAL